MIVTWPRVTLWHVSAVAHARGKEPSMGTFDKAKEQAEGKAEELKGKAREEFGDATDQESEEHRGKAEQLKGKAKQELNR